jgi:hypothetical protein
MKKEDKVRTCTYNKNRQIVDTVWPFCTWTVKNIVYPPFISWSGGLMTKDDCYDCKCYKKHVD